MISPLSCLCLFLLFFAATPSSIAVENDKKEGQQLQQFYIGIEINRMPYSSVDANGKAIGLLTTSISQLCKAIQVKCDFVIGHFDQMLKDIHFQKITALVVLDQLILPKTDKLQLTPPLCTLQPVFIHWSYLTRSTKASKLAGTTIGVQEGSPLHFYLLEKYADKTLIKPYSLLQSGMFDLLTKRIDRLATDKAFASANLKHTTFAKKYITTLLSSENIDEEDEDKDIKEPNFLDSDIFLTTQMTLAFRKDDLFLYKKLNQAIRERGQTPYCSDLLPSND
jgi:ABC-type amino acid transport substrate-binding protein